MPTTVKRGAGRPAAEAKRRKHAQRTPLPPRGKVGVAGGGVTAKAIAEERSLPPEAKKSMAKANAAADVARANGYDVELQQAGGFVKVIATKLYKDGTGERVEVAWINGRMSTDDMPKVIVSTVDNPDREVLLRNASAFKMQVSGKPSKPVALGVRAPRTSHKPDQGRQSSRGFDETATDVVILDALRGAQISWRNGTAGGKLEHGSISPNAKRGQHYRITEHPKKTGERVLHFIDAETRQYRVVCLSKIARVVK